FAAAAATRGDVELVADTTRRRISIGPCVPTPPDVADVLSASGRRPLAEDAGAPFGAVVTPGAAQTLAFGGATVEVPAGAVERDVRITIRPLAPDQVHPMDSLMENVIAGGRAYRFGPRGMIFKKPVKITLPFDAARLPSEISAHDVFAFYFDENVEKWRQVGRLGVTRPGALTSLTEHFTDFVNATRPLPE